MMTQTNLMDASPLFRNERREFRHVLQSPEDFHNIKLPANSKTHWCRAGRPHHLTKPRPGIHWSDNVTLIDCHRHRRPPKPLTASVRQSLKTASVTAARCTASKTASFWRVGNHYRLYLPKIIRV